MIENKIPKTVLNNASIGERKEGRLHTREREEVSSLLMLAEDRDK